MKPKYSMGMSGDQKGQLATDSGIGESQLSLSNDTQVADIRGTCTGV